MAKKPKTPEELAAVTRQLAAKGLERRFGESGFSRDEFDARELAESAVVRNRLAVAAGVPVPRRRIRPAGRADAGAVPREQGDAAAPVDGDVSLVRRTGPRRDGAGVVPSRQTAMPALRAAW